MTVFNICNLLGIFAGTINSLPRVLIIKFYIKDTHVFKINMESDVTKQGKKRAASPRSTPRC